MKPLGPGVTKATMHRLGGLLVVVAGRGQGRVFVSVLAYQPGRPNSDDDLWQNLSSALSDFSLTATIGWPRPEPVSGAPVATTREQVDAIADQLDSSSCTA
jgi:hypothetical protein